MSVKPQFELPLTPMGGPTPSELEHMSATLRRRWERAILRFHIARFCATVARSWSNRGRQAAVLQAMEHGILPKGAIPSPEQIRLLVKRFDEGARSIVDYRDGRQRSGVHPRALEARLMTVVEAAVATQRPRTAAGVRQKMEEVAETIQRQTGEEVWVPGVAKIRRLMHQLGVARQSVARHGPAAAEIDALPHATVPADGVFDVGTLDEFTLPVWVAYYDDRRRRWVSFRPEVILLQDYVSRAVVGYWVVDPTRRVDPDTGEWLPPKMSGFDKDDVFGVLLGAGFKELAQPSTRPFAGYTFNVLRWDNAAPHRKRAPDLRAVGMIVTEFPVERPINRGIVERLGGTLKRWCDGLVGHIDQYVPSDRVQADPDEVQEQTGQQHRRTTRTVVPTAALMRIDEFRDAFELVVRRYNMHHRHRSLGSRTPYDVFQSRLPRPSTDAAKRMRLGHDLLGLIPTEATTVTREGIVHRGRRYAFEIGGRWLALNTPVVHRPDPLGRGLFVETDDDAVTVLPPLEHWARGQKPAQVAEQQEAIIDALSAEVKALRAAADATAVGSRILQRADEAAKASFAAKPQPDEEHLPAEDEEEDDPPSGQAAPVTAGPPPVPGAGAAPDLFDPVAGFTLDRTIPDSRSRRRRSAGE